MKKLLSILMIAVLAVTTATAQNKYYRGNRAPLIQKPFTELPIGAIKADGWLLEMLERQASGATGHMDELYPLVMGERNGWLGGDGDQWERGPYWIDGLLPLAYLLDNEELKKKVQPWIEWAINSQKEDGSFGPDKDYPGEWGLQRNNAQDWWPRMVMLKILQQYYSATGDERVPAMFTKYFRYQLETLPKKPLNNWTFWATYRACDNLQAVYWLYNITGDEFLLELGELLHKQSFSLERMVDNFDLSRPNSIHCVNLAQGIKEPVIYYQQNKDKKHIETVKKAFSQIREYNGYPNGMYGGDELLHGNNPTQGVELCSIVEMMFSLEKMTEITGDVEFADMLERVAFNALPTQISDDFMNKQYFQMSNQITANRAERNFSTPHNGTDVVFGHQSGYPCCYSNMHQGWPKFTQNLWYATDDNGLAAMVYSPSSVTAKVADGQEVTIKEETYYPFDNKISFTVSFPKKKDSANFPLKLRIPKWCKSFNCTITNAKGSLLENNMQIYNDNILVINRQWNNGDKVELTLQMDLITSRWEENSVAIERGPLVYALKMDEKWEYKEFTGNDLKDFGPGYWQVTSSQPWNYGLVNFDRNGTGPGKALTVVADSSKIGSNYPWNLENCPIEIKAKAKRIPHWTRYNDNAGPLPYSDVYWEGMRETPEEEITLIPYGCTTLRIAQFPMLSR